ncbi:helix-turn-helix domain-containing protein [Paenirhodobacter populi]|uniref:helix-turn-helix domain-containing protein n=1 Tax=Paenirhodobacter populi TaxID=2306993 RepID=UPI0019D43535|nr:AraC family transcriptional regulator [Sinirhodobacter populi]
MNERTLARLIIRETGMTFGRWLQQLCILMASHQLAEGKTVHQLADALAMRPTALNTMFRKALGMIPG